MTRVAGKQQDTPPERPADPPFWVADADLYLGEPGAGVLPVRAHAPGDQVPHEHVVRYGWQDAAHVPEQWAAQPSATSSRAPAPPAPDAKAASSGSEEQ